MASRKKPDKAFYDRADDHIELANSQVRDAHRGEVSASFLYGAARFNAWNAACNAGSKAQFVDEREMIIKYFVAQYVKMLEDHLDDYVENYDEYIGGTP